MAVFVCQLGAQNVRLPSINPGGIVNAASFLPPTLPGGAIAQGSIFSIFGTDLGPKGLEARELPLRDTLGGVQVEVQTPDGRIFNPLMLYAGTTQINAVMLSEVPVGEHRLRVIRDGRAGPFRSVKVVRSSPGLFVQARDGLPRFAVAQANYSDGPQLLTRELPARPGDVVTIWATGLGPVSADQGQAQSVDSHIEVWIGGQQAEVLFKGRSSCCVGLDQLNIRAPDGPDNCRVPVRVVAGGVTSNDVTIATSRSGACGDQEPFPARVYVTRTQTEGTLHESAVALVRAFRQTDPVALPPLGTCLSYVPVGFPTLLGGIPPRPESVQISGPLGPFTIACDSFCSLDPIAPAPVIVPGAYSLVARGGTFVPFMASLTLSEPIALTNQPVFIRETGLTIEWTSNGSNDGVVISARHEGSFSPDLICHAKAIDREFHIPENALANLAAGPYTVSVGNYADSPLEFPTDGPETGRFVISQEELITIEADPPRLPSSPIAMPNGEIVHAELATSFSETQRGLMFRTILEPDRGMLFLYTRPGVYFFWMFRTLIPLDIIWLDSDRRIIFINADTPPCPPDIGRGCPSYGPSARSQFILELGAGEAARRGLGIGDRLDW